MAKVKTVLHAHPHFYNPPNGRKRTLDERAYTFFRKIPTLDKIVNVIFEKEIGVCALSACHTPTGGIDDRFQQYMKQLPLLDKDFDVDSHLDEGWIHIARKIPIKNQLPHITLLYSQEVRADYNGRPADINVIGINRLIQPSQDIDEIAKIAKEEGGFSELCHPNSLCGVGIEKAVEMVREEKTYVEGFNTSENQTINEELMRKLDGEGIRWIAVPDSHHYSQIDVAYATFESDLLDNFSIDRLRVEIQAGNFENHIGYLGEAAKFIDHTFPIIMSIPGDLMRNPKDIISALTKRK